MSHPRDILLADDHSKLDEKFGQVFEALKRDDRRQTLLNLDLFWALLAVHIRAEHVHLFPILLQKAGDAHLPEGSADLKARLSDDISTLRRDHDFFVKEIGKDVNRLRDGDIEETDSDDLREIERNLTAVGRRLRVHNELEEKDIYPLAPRLLTAREIAELKISITRELANIPPRFRGSM